jgi:predicted ATP-grasp superfamily ATP-dependent carboligase
VRALILADPSSRGALAGARALARAGWQVGLGTDVERSLVGGSRAVTSRHRLARPQAGLDAFTTDVREAVRASGADIVFPAGDDWLLALSEVRADVPATVPYPTHERVLRLLDKLQLAEAAAASGMHAPATTPATPDVLAGWDGPAIVKAATHRHLAPGTATRLEVERVPDAAAATARVAELAAAGADAVLQPVIRGSLHALTVVLGPGGSLLAAAQQRAERTWPVPDGASARAVTTDVDPSCLEAVCRLARSLDWEGLVEMQFLVDADGVWWLVDANARFYGSMQLAVSAGANLPDVWGRAALGAAPEEVRARPGVRYSWLEADLRRAMVERRGGLLVDVLGTARHAVGAAHSIISARDPRPMFSAASMLARGAMAKVVGRR